MQKELPKTTSLERLRNAFSHFMLLLTIAFGAVTTLTLIEEPSRTLQPTFATTTVRGPASVSTGPTVTNRPFMSTLEVGCELKEELRTVSEHVRLKSQTCGLDLNAGAVVKNQSNGYTATVFMQGTTAFTTDYLALVQGPNRILIESMANGETKTREVIVIKE